MGLSWLRVLFLTLVFCLLSALLPSQSQTVAGGTEAAIGSVAANPQANHRRAVVLIGTVTNIRIPEGIDGFGQRLCGQTFDLQDRTGVIEIWHIVRCAAMEASNPPVVVAEGDQITVHATIEAPPVNVKKPDGSGMGARAMATAITKQQP